MNGRQAQYGNTPPDSDAIESFALKKTVRIGVDNARLGRGYTASRHDIQGERFEYKQIAPSPRNGITGTAASRKLDQHVTALDESSELRAFTAGR